MKSIVFAVVALLVPAFAASNAAAVTWTPDEQETPAYSNSHAVSCASASSCMAVGRQTDSGETFFDVWAEYWNGSSWAAETVAVPVGVDDTATELADVSCADEDACVTVGNSSSGPFASVWDGSSWDADMIDNSGYLSAVSCADTDACMAVGQAGLTAEWDGTGWTQQSAAGVPGSVAVLLYDVSCVAANDCTAVGRAYTSGYSNSFTVVQRWNGSAWTLVSSPNPGSGSYPYLAGVSCTASNACTAVGSYYNSGNKGLVERWNGTSWTIQSSPDAFLVSVSCSASNACTAVGDMIQSWNGTVWSVDESDGQRDLFGVSCTSPAACVAVGRYYDSGFESYNAFATRSSL